MRGTFRMTLSIYSHTLSFIGIGLREVVPIVLLSLINSSLKIYIGMFERNDHERRTIWNTSKRSGSGRYAHAHFGLKISMMRADNGLLLK